MRISRRARFASAFARYAQSAALQIDAQGSKSYHRGLLERQTILSLQTKKNQKQPIVALTCYDAASAGLIDDIGVDIALVGDSLANTRLGYRNTLPITLDEMIHHTRAASRGVSHALLVADMPFQSYEAAPWEVARGRYRRFSKNPAALRRCMLKAGCVLKIPCWRF